MRLTLKNVGMLKEAEINLNGLTLIAGENDTGKSTVLKTMFCIVKGDNISHSTRADEKKSREILANRFNLVFDGNVSTNGQIVLYDGDNNKIMDIEIKDNNYVSKFERNPGNKERLFDSTFIPSPLIFDFVDFFNSVAKMKEKKKFDLGLDFEIKYPYIMWDLYYKLTTQNNFNKAKQYQKIFDFIYQLINGKFVVEKASNNVWFYKDELKDHISMFNTAMGIKFFGALQLLNQNGYFHRKYLLLIDEPESHLHPHWQLKAAEIIVEIVKRGIKVVVTSHSPYMLEALDIFSKKGEINYNFYYAQGGEIKEDSDLSYSIKKLVAPMKELKRLRYE